jgi:hypothetical protein
LPGFGRAFFLTRVFGACRPGERAAIRHRHARRQRHDGAADLHVAQPPALVQSAGATVSIAETRRTGRHCTCRLLACGPAAEWTMPQRR